MQPQMHHTTEALKLARLGVASSVDVFLKILDSHKVFLPLAIERTAEKQFSLFRLQNQESKEFVNVGFTDDQLLSNAGAQYKWQTSGANGLKLIEVTIRDFFRNSLTQCEKQKSCLVLNPGHETQLDLTTDEVFKLLNNDNKALNRHLQRLPIQQSEEIVVSDLSQESVSAALDVAIRSAVRKFTDFAKISYFSISSAQRDKPVFLITVKTKENIIYSNLISDLNTVINPLLPNEFDSFNVRIDYN